MIQGFWNFGNLWRAIREKPFLSKWLFWLGWKIIPWELVARMRKPWWNSLDKSHLCFLRVHTRYLRPLPRRFNFHPGILVGNFRGNTNLTSFSVGEPANGIGLRINTREPHPTYPTSRIGNHYSKYSATNFCRLWSVSEELKSTWCSVIVWSAAVGRFRPIRKNISQLWSTVIISE